MSVLCLRVFNRSLAGANIRLDFKDEPSPLAAAKLLRTNQCCQILGFHYASLNRTRILLPELVGTVRVHMQHKDLDLGLC